MKSLENKFNQFIESEIIDKNEFQEYEICITEFDNKQNGKTKKENTKT